MPQYEELIRRALAMRERAKAASHDSARVRELAKLLRDADAGRTLLLHCAWCGRLRVGKEWLDLTAGQFKIAESLVRGSSHGICPDCFARENKKATRTRAERSNAPPRARG